MQQHQAHQQQQQQQQPAESFYAKLRHSQMDPPEPHSPPNSRKEQMSINSFKMRNREISKRLARASRPPNGHGDLHYHQLMEVEPSSPAVSPAIRVPPTNGDSPQNSSKPLTSDSHHSSASFDPPSPSKNTIEYRAMRELLSEDHKRPSGSPFSMDQNAPQTHNDAQLKINQSFQDRMLEKLDLDTPQQAENPETIHLPSSPMQFSNDSNNSEEGIFDESRSEYEIVIF